MRAAGGQHHFAVVLFAAGVMLFTGIGPADLWQSAAEWLAVRKAELGEELAERRAAREAEGDYEEAEEEEAPEAADSLGYPHSPPESAGGH